MDVGGAVGALEAADDGTRLPPVEQGLRGGGSPALQQGLEVVAERDADYGKFVPEKRPQPKWTDKTKQTLGK